MNEMAEVPDREFTDVSTIMDTYDMAFAAGYANGSTVGRLRGSGPEAAASRVRLAENLDRMAAVALRAAGEHAGRAAAYRRLSRELDGR